jgi:hypothetical protein
MELRAHAPALVVVAMRDAEIRSSATPSISISASLSARVVIADESVVFPRGSRSIRHPAKLIFSDRRSRETGSRVFGVSRAGRLRAFHEVHLARQLRKRE